MPLNILPLKCPSPFSRRYLQLHIWFAFVASSSLQLGLQRDRTGQMRSLNLVIIRSMKKYYEIWKVWVFKAIQNIFHHLIFFLIVIKCKYKNALEGSEKKYFNCKIYLKLQQLSSPTGVSKNIKDKKPDLEWGGKAQTKRHGIKAAQECKRPVANWVVLVLFFELRGKKKEKKKKKSPTPTNQPSPKWLTSKKRGEKKRERGPLRGGREGCNYKTPLPWNDGTLENKVKVTSPRWQAQCLHKVQLHFIQMKHFICHHKTFFQRNSFCRSNVLLNLNAKKRNSEQYN